MSELTTGNATQYAAHRGLTPQAVAQAIRDGRIVDSVERNEHGHFVIDFEAADSEWQATTRTPVAGKRGGQKPRETKGPTITESRRIREAYNAQLSKLDYQERAQQLCGVADTRSKAFTLARQVRDAILAVPHRTAALVRAAESDHEAAEIMRGELLTALESLDNAQ